MTEQNFRKLLSRGTAVGYNYKNDGQAGLVNIWLYKDRFIISWEECKDGDQFNESNYTRDDLNDFPDINSVIEYLNNSNILIEPFEA